ncbi:Pkg21D, partial [Symbiodinium microadriaticum]
RKANAADPTETPQLLAKLGANAFMGEISLLTQEPRTATITVISPVAKVLVMTKAKFDGVMQVVNAHLFSDKKEIGREVVNKVPLFQSLSSAKKKSILNSMRPMNFLPNTYVCRQGSSGNTFYIIADGTCRVTVNTGKGTEKEVTRLSTGDFFGEVALIEPSNKRTANVISISNVSCMTLSRQDFTQLLSNVRNTLIENSSVRTLALRKVKKDNKVGKGHIGKRRVTVMDEHNQKNAVLVPGVLRLLVKSMTEALYLSLYSRLYRELVLKPDVVEQYGDTARSVAVMHTHRDAAVAAISQHCRTIGKIDPNDRSAADNGFIYA